MSMRFKRQANGCQLIVCLLNDGALCAVFIASGLQSNAIALDPPQKQK